MDMGGGSDAFRHEVSHVTDPAFEDIPGTTLFDAERSRKGYQLNMFCMSLMKAENRELFRADQTAYMKNFPMTAEQMDTIHARDWNKLLALGGNIFFIGKIAVTDGMSFAQLAAKMCGKTNEEYVAMMIGGGRSVDGNRSKSTPSR
jgi:protocatechuate 4,5-dioxygenase alpha chain